MTASWAKESFNLRGLRSMVEWVEHISQDPDTKIRLREAGPILLMNVDGPGEEKGCMTVCDSLDA